MHNLRRQLTLPKMTLQTQRQRIIHPPPKRRQDRNDRLPRPIHKMLHHPSPLPAAAPPPCDSPVLTRPRFVPARYTGNCPVSEITPLFIINTFAAPGIIISSSFTPSKLIRGRNPCEVTRSARLLNIP